MSYGIGLRHGSDLAWLWQKPVAPIGPLAWEPPYAADADLKKNTQRLGMSIFFFFFGWLVSWFPQHVDVPGPRMEPVPQERPEPLQRQ